MALELSAAESHEIQVICTPIHGPGYGLDEREAFLSLVGGFLDGIESGRFPRELKIIEVVERTPRRADRLKVILSQVVPGAVISDRSQLGARLRAERGGLRQDQGFTLAATSSSNLSSFGLESEQKTKLFVAMPFAPKHSDLWDIAIQESCQNAGLLCERIDEQSFTGDILTEIKSRLQTANGVVAVLNDAKPNVFLEIGFAWGVRKPTVLISKKGAKIPFDVRGQKCIQYTSIHNLRTLLTAELMALKAQGVFK